MKNTILLFILSLCLSTLSRAQMNLGLKAGLNAAYFHHTNISDFPNSTEYRSAVFFHVGLLSQQSFNDNWGLQTELIYNQKGASIADVRSGFSETKVRLRLNYLSLPIMATYQAGRFQIEAGPEVSYLLSANLRTDAPNSNPGMVESLYEEKDFNLGLNAGISFLVGRRFLPGVRYHYGLSSLIDIITTDFNGEPSESMKQKNQVFQLSIAYLLNVSRQ